MKKYTINIVKVTTSRIVMGGEGTRDCALPIFLLSMATENISSFINSFSKANFQQVISGTCLGPGTLRITSPRDQQGRLSTDEAIAVPEAEIRSSTSAWRSTNLEHQVYEQSL